MQKSPCLREESTETASYSRLSKRSYEAVHAVYIGGTGNVRPVHVFAVLHRISNDLSGVIIQVLDSNMLVRRPMPGQLCLLERRMTEDGLEWCHIDKVVGKFYFMVEKKGVSTRKRY